MRERQEELVQTQRQHLESLREKALAIVRDATYPYDEQTNEALRGLAIWIQQRAQRYSGDQLHGTKVSLTRLRLLGLQLEKILELLGTGVRAEEESQLCSRLEEILTSQQQRDLYDDMISCLRELSALSIERGQGRQAVLYNEMAGRLETRLECGHLSLDDLEQRRQDETLYREFREKLVQLKATT